MAKRKHKRKDTMPIYAAFADEALAFLNPYIPDSSYATLSTPELQSMLRQHGKNTRSLKRQKLIETLQEIDRIEYIARNNYLADIGIPNDDGTPRIRLNPNTVLSFILSAAILGLLTLLFSSKPGGA